MNFPPPEEGENHRHYTEVVMNLNPQRKKGEIHLRYTEEAENSCFAL